MRKSTMTPGESNREKKICLGKTGEESQYIFNDGVIKSRLKRDGYSKTGEEWFIAEYKTVEGKEEWMPWIAGTALFLVLSEQEKAWAK